MPPNAPSRSAADPDELAGAIAVVTGAGAGIGRAAALRLAAAGARVIVTDRRGHAAEETAGAIGAAGGSARAHELDVTDASAVGALLEGVCAADGRLDILVNNAGVVHQPRPLAEFDVEEFDRVFAVNVRGVFLGLRHGLAAMIRQGGGAIVNVASVTAVRNEQGLGPYAASKHAIVALTRAAATEAGPHGVRVNALLPGPTATAVLTGRPGSPPTGAAEAYARRVPLGRVSQPEEQAEAIAYLASPRASFVTGATLLSDGGLAHAL